MAVRQLVPSEYLAPQQAARRPRTSARRRQGGSWLRALTLATMRNAANVRAVSAPLRAPAMVAVALSIPAIYALCGHVQMTAANFRMVALRHQVNEVHKRQHVAETRLAAARSEDAMKKWTAARGLEPLSHEREYHVGVGLVKGD